jgi:hypothetical protein
MLATNRGRKRQKGRKPYPVDALELSTFLSITKIIRNPLPGVE